MTCVGYPGYGFDEPNRLWCTDHQRWHDHGEVNKAVELFFDALEAPDPSYYDRQSGIVDLQAREIVTALLAAGWRPPEKGNS